MASPQYKVAGIPCRVKPENGGGTWLYYVQLPFSMGFKIGITNSIHTRFSEEINITILYAKPFYNAEELEQDILDLFSHVKMGTAKLLCSGNTEIFIEDIRNEET